MKTRCHLKCRRRLRRDQSEQSVFVKLNRAQVSRAKFKRNILLWVGRRRLNIARLHEAFTSFVPRGLLEFFNMLVPACAV
jgi:hypothetical protein